MFYISKIGDYLRILTDDEVKDLVAINFSEYFKCTKDFSSLLYNFNLIKILFLL